MAAISSAGIGFRRLTVLGIDSLLLARSSPKRNQMVELALLVFSYFKDERIEVWAHPANRSILLREIRSLVQIVRAIEDCPRLFKSDAVLGSLPQALAFARIEVEARDV
jgi:hypothetical protein